MATQQKCTSNLDFNSGISAFAWNLYKCFSRGDANVFLSPYSVSAALLLANLGAKGNTESEIRTALGLQTLSQDDAHILYKSLQETLNKKTSGTTTLAIANRMFARRGLEVVETYKADSEKFYESQLELMDFLGKPEESRQGINQWVEEQTNNKIQDLLPSGSISPTSLVVLVNAIYFKGKWEEQFDAKHTAKHPFYVSHSHSVKVDMMHAKLKLLYHRDENLGCVGVELPYQSESVVMVVVLPDENDGLETLETKLTPARLQKFCEDLHKARKPEVKLVLPKFKMELTYDMKMPLVGLGVKSLMDPNTADLSGMLKDAPDAHVSDVIHKSFIEVNEEGTEAAAATAMMIRCMSIPMPPEMFTADHPFLFLIRDTDTGSILFLGRYATPPE